MGRESGSEFAPSSSEMFLMPGLSQALWGTSRPHLCPWRKPLPHVPLSKPPDRGLIQGRDWQPQECQFGFSPLPSCLYSAIFLLSPTSKLTFSGRARSQAARNNQHVDSAKLTKQHLRLEKTRPWPGLQRGHAQSPMPVNNYEAGPSWGSRRP